MYVHIDIWEVWSTLSVALMWPCQSWTKVTLQCSPKSLLTLEALLLRPFNASSTIYCVNVFMWSGLGFINIDNYFVHVFLPVLYVWHIYFERPIPSRSFVSRCYSRMCSSEVSFVLLILIIALYFLSDMYFG